MMRPSEKISSVQENPSAQIARRCAERADFSSEWFVRQPIIHRGLHNIFDGVIEQSRKSITRAIAAGLPIEVDIENSIDDRSFVIHDPVLDKMTNGHGRLRNLPAKTIRSYSLHHTDGEPIMYLEELLDLVDGRVPLILEFKNRELAIPRAIADAAEVLSHYRGKFAVSSFSPILMEWFRDHYPRFTRGLVTTDTDSLEGRDQFIVCMLRNRMKLDFVIHQWCQLNCWTFQWVAEQNLPILMWTVRDNDDWDIARTYADNILFEFIEPDKENWREPAITNWRGALGEKVDRRFCKNQPTNLKHDSFKGLVPWWARNRSWAPTRTPKPPGAETETMASYDAVLLSLSVFQNKRELYKDDPHFRGAWSDWKREFSDDALEKAAKTAFILLRPECILSARAGDVLEAIRAHGFIAATSFKVDLHRSACHELMRYEWVHLAAQKIELELESLKAGALIGLFLFDQTPEPGLPASVRLSAVLHAHSAEQLAGRSARVRIGDVINANEPADLIRQSGALMDRQLRQQVFRELREASLEMAARCAAGDTMTALSGSLGLQETMRALRPAVMSQGSEAMSAVAVQASLPDRPSLFGALEPNLARRLWISRAT